MGLAISIWACLVNCQYNVGSSISCSVQHCDWVIVTWQSLSNGKYWNVTKFYQSVLLQDCIFLENFLKHETIKKLHRHKLIKLIKVRQYIYQSHDIGFPLSIFLKYRNQNFKFRLCITDCQDTNLEGFILNVWWRGAWKLTGENLKIVWAEFSTLS